MCISFIPSFLLTLAYLFAQVFVDDLLGKDPNRLPIWNLKELNTLEIYIDIFNGILYWCI